MTKPRLHDWECESIRLGTKTAGTCRKCGLWSPLPDTTDQAILAGLDDGCPGKRPRKKVAE